MTEHYHAFFCKNACRYYPCHEGLKAINCLFCFCPLYPMAHCPGTPAYIESGGARIKDCSACVFPHREENYDKVLACLRHL